MKELITDTAFYAELESFCSRHGLFLHSWEHDGGWTCWVMRANRYVCQGNGWTRETAALQALPKAKEFVEG